MKNSLIDIKKDCKEMIKLKNDINIKNKELESRCNKMLTYLEKEEGYSKYLELYILSMHGDLFENIIKYIEDK